MLKRLREYFAAMAAGKPAPLPLLSMTPAEMEALETRAFAPGEIASCVAPVEIQYASRTARLFAWVLRCRPLRHIGRWQDNATCGQLKQIFGEFDAQPISVGMILRGPKSSALPRSTSAGRGESK
jgi:hypothetical protein